MTKTLQKLLFYSVLISAITVVVLLWIMNIIKLFRTGLVGDLDFPSYYSASYIIRFVDAHKLYDIELQRQIQANLLNAHHIPFDRLYPYNHPPVYIGLLYSIANLDYNTSYLLWMLYLVCFHIIATWLLADLSKKQGYPPPVQAGIIIGSIFFLPIHIAYVRGQDSALLLMAVTLWMYGLQRKRPWLTTLGLTLTMIRPQIALGLLILTLAYNWKIIYSLLAWGALFFALNFPWIGWQGIQGFLNMLHFSARGFDGYGFDIDDMATIMGAILRTFPHITPQLLHTIGYSIYFVTILILAWWWKQTGELTLPHIGFVIPIILLVSPHAHYQDYSLILLPAVIVSLLWVKQNHISATSTVLIPLSISLLFFIQIFLIGKSQLLIYITSLLLTWLFGKHIIQASSHSTAELKNNSS